MQNRKGHTWTLWLKRKDKKIFIFKWQKRWKSKKERENEKKMKEMSGCTESWGEKRDCDSTCEVFTAFGR